MLRNIRKTILLGIVSLALVSCGQHPSSPSRMAAATTESWIMYQHSPDHNAVLTKPTNVDTWQFDAGARINGGFAVVGNTLLLDTFNNELVALDVRSGKVLWRSKSDNVLMSTPVVANGLIYVGSGDNGRLAGGSGPSTYASTYSSAHAAQVNPTWGRPEGDAMLAYDLTTGKQRWIYRTVGEDMPSPAIVGDTLIFANGDLHMYGLNTQTGEQRWMREVDGLATMASATVASGLTYLSICNDAPYRCQTLAVDAPTGRVAWHAPFGNSDSSPAFGDGRIYVSGIVNEADQARHTGYGVVAALDAKTGQTRWTYRTPHAGPYTEVGSSERAIAGTFADGIYYQPIPTHDQLLAFDASTGAIRWRFASAAPIKMSPIVKGGKLYVGDTAGILYTLNARTGALQTSRLFKKPFTTSPPVMIGKTMLVANDSIVYAFATK